MVKADGSIIIDTRLDTKGFESGTNRVKQKMGGLMDTAKRLGATIAAAFAVREIVAFAKECIELGSNLDEVQNVVDVTFGKMSGRIEEFSKTAAESFGLSELSAKQYTSTIGAMFKSMGFAGDELTDMSIKIAELSGDMASFYNLDTDTAFQKIRSGISGETEPLKQLGVNMSEVNLQQFAMTQGMEKAYKDMNQQEKALVRYKYLLSVTSDAQGDFARTSDGWANQLRIVKLRLDSIKADLGKGFINVLTPVLKVINTIIAAIAKMASAFKAFTVLLTGKDQDTNVSTGEALTDDFSSATDAAEEYTDAATDAAKATDANTEATKAANKANKSYLSGLDQIHQYTKQDTDTTNANTAAKKASTTPSTTSASTGGMDFGKLVEGETVIDKVDQKMKAFFDRIQQFMQPTIDALKRLWSEGLVKLKDFAAQGLYDFYSRFLKPVGKWVMGEGLPRFINAITDMINNIDWDRINGKLRELWDRLAPFAVKIGEGLLWFWENVLTPLGSWIGNEVVPRFIENISKGIELFDAILDALKPEFQWFWDEVLTPIAEWAAEKFTEFWDWWIDKLDAFTKWCKDNPETVAAITEAVLAFFAAWKVIEFILKAAMLIKALGSILAGINPVTTAIALLIAAGVLLWRNWDTVKAKAIEIWDKISNYFAWKWEQLRKWATEKFTNAKNAVIETWEGVKAKAGEIWNNISTAILTVWNNLKAWATEKFNAAKAAVINAWETVQAKTTEVWSAVKTTVLGAWNNVKNWATEKFNAAKAAVVNAWDTVQSKTTEIWSAVTTAVSGAWDNVKRWASEKFSAAKASVINAWENVQTTTTNIWSSVTSTVSGAWTNVKKWAADKFDAARKSVIDSWDAIKRNTRAAWEQGKQTVGGMLTTAWDAITTGVDTVFPGARKTIIDAWDAVKRNTKNAWETGKTTIGGILTGAWDTITEKVTDVGTAIHDAFFNAFDTLANALKVPINAVIGVINGMISGINAMIDAIEDALTFDVDIWNPFGENLHWHAGVDIPWRVSYIPELAKGAVIPPNAPFLATLGDQKHGTNIEAPLETIKQAIREEGATGDIRIQMFLDGRVVYETVVNQAKRQQQMTGRPAFA